MARWIPFRKKSIFGGLRKMSNSEQEIKEQLKTVPTKLLWNEMNRRGYTCHRGD